MRHILYIDLLVILAKVTHETQTGDDGMGRTGLLLIKILISQFFYPILDQTRSVSSGTEKSHGTRLSDQSIDDTMRKSTGTKSANVEAKVPEPFDVNKNYDLII